jgi:hypothetical protein
MLFHAGKSVWRLAPSKKATNERLITFFFIGVSTSASCGGGKRDAFKGGVPLLGLHVLADTVTALAPLSRELVLLECSGKIQYVTDYIQVQSDLSALAVPHHVYHAGEYAA